MEIPQFSPEDVKAFAINAGDISTGLLRAVSDYKVKNIMSDSIDANSFLNHMNTEGMKSLSNDAKRKISEFISEHDEECGSLASLANLINTLMNKVTEKQ